jgi:hypothetical protein
MRQAVNKVSFSEGGAVNIYFFNIFNYMRAGED